MSAKGERICDRVVELFLNGHMTWREARATLQTYGADERFIADSIGTPAYAEWCRDPDACVGKGYCPRDPTCGD